MRPTRFALPLALAATFALAARPADGQELRFAAGPAVERGRSTGVGVQLAYTLPAGARPLGLRVDLLYAQRAGEQVEGSTPGSGFRQSPTRTYALTGALQYQPWQRGAVRPYALLGGGFYNRNAYTAGYALGVNGGLGVDLHLERLALFAEARLHQFQGRSSTPWFDGQRVRLVPLTIGIRF